MKKIYSSIMVAALFASAVSCTSGNSSSAGSTQTAKGQACPNDGIPEGGDKRWTAPGPSGEEPLQR